MKPLFALLLAGAATPALAQHAGHAVPAEAPAAACPPEHAAMGHCKPEADPHAGHAMPAEAPPVGPPPAEALSGPAHAADTLFGAEAMGRSRRTLATEHGGMIAGKLLVDQLEARIGKGRDSYLLDAEAWIGGDIDKAWFKTEIEGERGRSPEQAEVQALWSHAIDPWFDLQAGLRQDFGEGPDRTHLVLGVQGLAPYWIHVEGALFLSHKGELSARLEAEHDVRLTQKLILQPRAEFDLSAQDVPSRRIGAGLSTADLGLRLRYHFSPQLAPYAGVSWERSFGDTRRFRRLDGEGSGGLKFVTGLRFWF